ncbi:MAG: hypothetical protein J0H07_10475 [Sphingobacteriales bacterium]|nr:hypothetical protein [Sphingobacteriales bacterium]
MISAATRIDENLSLVFPGEVQRIDTLGVSLFQTVQDKITYQVVRKVRVIETPMKSAWKEAIDQAAATYLGGLRFKNFEKQSKDTVIGYTMGRYIQMVGIDHGQTMRLFIFTTLANTDMYSIQVTSFNDGTITRQSLQWFYSHLQFKGISY